MYNTVMVRQIGSGLNLYKLIILNIYNNIIYIYIQPYNLQFIFRESFKL